MKQNRVYFPNLDVLRCIAAFMIVVIHGNEAYQGWFGSPPDPTTYSPINNFIANLNLGVEFFFIISGFLITTLLLQEKGLTGRVSLGNFYLRRILRIWPLYFLLVVLAPWWVWYCGAQSPDYFYTVTFTNNFHAIATGQWQFPFAHYWSICVEEHFYLVWPFIIMFVPLKKLPLVFASIILASFIYKGYMFFYAENWAAYHKLSTFSRMDALAIGSWLGYIHYRKPLFLSIKRSILIPAYIVMLILFFALCDRDLSTYPSLVSVLFGKYVFVAIFLFILIDTLFNSTSMLNFKKRNLLHYFGKLSFGIYMIHNMLFLFVAKKLMLKWETDNVFVFWSVYLFVLILLSVITYEFFEKWFLKLKDKFAIVKTRAELT